MAIVPVISDVHLIAQDKQAGKTLEGAKQKKNKCYKRTFLKL